MKASAPSSGTTSATTIGILFVCLGNICRSPAAEGVFRYLVKQSKRQQYFHIDSCGTASYHLGELPHQQTRAIAASHGIALDSRARQFQLQDFSSFEYILAMDTSNYNDLLRLIRRPEDQQRLYMFRNFDPIFQKQGGQNAPDMPDPYYGGIAGFEEVHTIALRTGQSLLDQLISKHKLFSLPS